MTTSYHAQFWAHSLTLLQSGGTVDGLSRAVSGARVDLNPHQVDAALFALRSPLARGVVLADGMLFGGFRRCLYPVQKFDSDAERQFASLLETDESVAKWFRPSRGDLRIFYGQDQSYEPDFVVETEAAKYLCEPKQASQMEDGEVLAKARAAVEWCRHATGHEVAHGGKSWHYLLIPHDQIRADRTLAWLAERFEVRPAN